MKQQSVLSNVRNCRYCGCTEMRACLLTVTTIVDAPNARGRLSSHIRRERCAWLDATKRCCTSPACMEKEEKRRKNQ